MRGRCRNAVAVGMERSKYVRVTESLSHAFVVSRVAKPLAAVKVKGLMRFDFDPSKTLYMCILNCSAVYVVMRHEGA